MFAEVHYTWLPGDAVYCVEIMVRKLLFWGVLGRLPSLQTVLT